MSYIYKITNDINQKVYIGQTSKSIEERWSEHKADYAYNKKNRPLYSAMLKYGFSHFHIEQIEECSQKDVQEREIYWIAYYNSYHNGYNATKGGEGTVTIDYSLVLDLWEEGKGVKEIANLIGCSEWSIGTFLSRNNITPEQRYQRNIQNRICSVEMIDVKTNKILKIFPSIAEANIFIGQTRYSGHIGQVCKGKRQTAGGYKWRYHK